MIQVNGQNYGQLKKNGTNLYMCENTVLEFKKSIGLWEVSLTGQACLFTCNLVQRETSGGCSLTKQNHTVSVVPTTFLTCCSC